MSNDELVATIHFCYPMPPIMKYRWLTWVCQTSGLPSSLANGAWYDWLSNIPEKSLATRGRGRWHSVLRVISMFGSKGIRRAYFRGENYSQLRRGIVERKSSY